jgi:CheY-like chemotaxis protein
MQRTIMVVDDDDLVRKTMDKVLGKSGYAVILAGSGKEALEKLSQKDVKVFILDLMMPGMDGIELCRAIKKKIGAECMVYALTGHVSDYDVDECRRAGFDDYFAKPFKLNLILKMIEQAFEKVQRWHAIGKRVDIGSRLAL